MKIRNCLSLLVVAWIVAASSLSHAQGVVRTDGSSTRVQATQMQPADAGPPPDHTTAPERYRIEPEDTLIISFALSPELNQTVAVRPDGYVSMWSVGEVFVKDLTVPEVAQAIRKAYSGTLHEPIVDVDLKEFQRPVFYVSGQVGKPGQYELRYRLSVMQAIAIGGGLSQTAKTQVVLMHRVSNEWAEVKVLNLRKVVHGQALLTDAMVMPGDLIFVPEKIIVGFRKYVPYGLGLSFSPANSNILY